jgi:hypothetical protein
MSPDAGGPSSGGALPGRPRARRSAPASTRLSIESTRSMKVSMASCPTCAPSARTRAPWLAMTSSMFRSVCANQALARKKSACPHTCAMTSFCSTGALWRSR